MNTTYRQKIKGTTKDVKKRQTTTKDVKDKDKIDKLWSVLQYSREPHPNIRRRNVAKNSKFKRTRAKIYKTIVAKKWGIAKKGSQKRKQKCRTIQSLDIDPTGCRTSTCAMNCLEPGVGHEWAYPCHKFVTDYMLGKKVRKNNKHMTARRFSAHCPICSNSRGK